MFHSTELHMTWRHSALTAYEQSCYLKKWKTGSIRKDQNGTTIKELEEVVRYAAKMILRNESRFCCVANALYMPFEIVGVLHMRESSFDFKKHLHNGDPLTGKTTHVPAGRPIADPKDGKQYIWEESAIDAISYQAHELGIKLETYEWDVPNFLFFLEAWNGAGYRNRSRAGTWTGNTPYLWSYTDHYCAGKYASDGKFDPELIDRQPGCVPVLKQLGFPRLTPNGT